MSSRPQTALRAWALRALLLPFFLLCLLPPGVMPGRDAAGVLTLTLCGDAGAGEVIIDLATGQPVEKAPSDDGDRCAWACGQWAAADLASPFLPLPLRDACRETPRPAAFVLRAAAITGLPPATGPPLKA
ncbi:MAG: hypothetical protein ACK4GM_04060 [Tabrizicola sp.]